MRCCRSYPEFTVSLALFCAVPAASTSAQGENVLLISVDTLRADRLSCYGYSGNSTPNIDRWAEEGVRFANAYTEYPLTLPAHATLLTGAYPPYHGIRENVGFTLDEDHLTLAEVFQQNGYATGAFIASYVLSSEFGISQGFETFDEDFVTAADKVLSSAAVARRTLSEGSLPVRTSYSARIIHVEPMLARAYLSHDCSSRTARNVSRAFMTLWVGSRPRWSSYRARPS